ncbi:MAG TPA: hypothetical protein VFG09_04380 [Thermodesulfovibrionales bacterium]|jgi:hypothetical protein|nr:hypothetical protein [Thermodesulfovibrionales bacterium]
MMIRSIQMNQMSPAVYRQSDGGAEAKSVSPDTSVSARPSDLPAQNVLAHIDYFKEQLDAILTQYPPFFPPGSYQRIDLIKKIRGLQDEVGKSSLPADIKKAVGGQKLADDATDGEIGAAIQGLLNVSNKASQKISAVKDAARQGSILNTRV